MSYFWKNSGSRGKSASRFEINVKNPFKKVDLLVRKSQNAKFVENVTNDYSIIYPL